MGRSARYENTSAFPILHERSPDGLVLIKHVAVLLAGILGVIYLFNPTAGVFEIIPDNFPLIGNLDEVAACALVLAAFRYFGVDLTAFLGNRLNKDFKEKDSKKK